MLWALHPLKQVLPTYFACLWLLFICFCSAVSACGSATRNFPQIHTGPRGGWWLPGFSSPLHIIRLKCWSQFPYLWNVFDIGICIYVCIYIHIHMSPIRIDPKPETMNDIAVSILFSTPYNFPPMSPIICIYIYV